MTNFDKLEDTNRRAVERLAYRMLGTWADAEDIAQESLLKWYKLGVEKQNTIREPLAWLNKVATRLCIDKIRSIQSRRERYVGPWLPEPILIDNTKPSDRIDREESVNMAFMIALERLSASERAAFLLHDIFDYSFDAVAEILEKSEAACRKLASRARQSIQDERVQFDFDPDKHLRLLTAFSQAVMKGDTIALEQALAADVALISDGGGIAPASRKILHTREILIRFYLGIRRKTLKRKSQVEVRFQTINGLPGLVHIRDGALDSALSLSVSNDRIQTIFQQRNPEKLKQISQQLNLDRSVY